MLDCGAHCARTPVTIVRLCKPSSLILNPVGHGGRDNDKNIVLQLMYHCLPYSFSTYHAINDQAGQAISFRLSPRLLLLSFRVIIALVMLNQAEGNAWTGVWPAPFSPFKQVVYM